MSETAWTTDKGERRARKKKRKKKDEVCGGKRAAVVSAFLCACFAVRMQRQHFKWLKRDSCKLWDGINSAALVLKGALLPLRANHGKHFAPFVNEF